MANLNILNNQTNGFEYPSHAIQAASLNAFCKDSSVELSLPDDHENAFSNFVGQEVSWNPETVKFQAEPGSYYALRSLFTILAGRFQSSSTIIELQSEVLSTDSNPDGKYFSNNLRHLGLEVEEVSNFPLFMNDDQVVPAEGNYFSLKSENRFIDGGKLINSMAHAKLIENLPQNTRWDQLTGLQNQGNQVEALASVVSALDGVQPGDRVLLRDIINNNTEVPFKSVRNVIKRLEKLGLVEYHQFHGGYIFKQEVAKDISFLKTNWEKLNTGEIALIGNREAKFPGETQEHRDQRVGTTKTIVEAYNDFVISKNLEIEEPVEFTATDFIKYIRTNEKYSKADISPANIQIFLRRMLDTQRGAMFVEEEYTEKEPEYIYTKKEYITASKQAFVVDDNQGLLFRKVDFSKLPSDWNEFIDSLKNNAELDTTYKLALYLFDKSGLFVTREELNEAMETLGVSCDKKGFHSRYMDAQETDKNLIGYITVSGEEEANTVSRINTAFYKANEYARFLSKNQQFMQELFSRNILNPGNPKIGELTGLHKVRENAAKVLVDYLVSYRKDS